MIFDHTIFSSNPFGYVILGFVVLIVILVLTVALRCMYYTGKTCQICSFCCCHRLQQSKQPLTRTR